MTPAEVEARGHVWTDRYSKVRAIEARCALEMAQTMILPTAMHYQKNLCDSISAAQAILGNTAGKAQVAHLQELSAAIDSLSATSKILSVILSEAFFVSFHKLKFQVDGKSDHDGGGLERAELFYNRVRPAVEGLRASCDTLEAIIDTSMWPIPKYSDLFATF